MTAKELLKTDSKTMMVTVYGCNFWLTADIIDIRPVVYIDNSRAEWIELDNEKNFNTTENCIRDIKKQLRRIHSDLGKEIANEEQLNITSEE